LKRDLASLLKQKGATLEAATAAQQAVKSQLAKLRVSCCGGLTPHRRCFEGLRGGWGRSWGSRIKTPLCWC